ncbi:MAG TPA: pyridoxal phosphate-dependent aminotransferase [Planctomycetota bacterium]
MNPQTAEKSPVRPQQDPGADPAAAGLSAMARRMRASSILTIAGDVRELKDRGVEVADLTVGDFSPAEFPMPARLAELLHQALRDGEVNYPPAAGVKELRQAVREHLLRTQQLDYPIESIAIVGGARPALYSAYRLLTDPGDTVLYPVPSWNNQNYRDICELNARSVLCRPEDAFQPTAALLAPHVRDAKLLVLNTPQNPSGGVMPRAEMQRFGELLVEENARRQRTGGKPFYLILDQIYRALVFPGSEHFSPVQLVPECRPYVVHVDGISKFCAATGLRVGWLAAPPAIASKAVALLTHLGAWAPRPAQVASAKFLREIDTVAAWEAEMVERVRERLQVLHECVQELRDAGLPVSAVPPQGAIYMAVRFDLAGRVTPAGEVLRSNEDIRSYLLQNAAFALVPFSAFGVAAEHENGWFRASVGAIGTDALRAAVPRVASAIRALS